MIQPILDGLGWFLAVLYDLVRNYGIAIILLTLVIRVALVPLGIKQIRSMQAMQAIQPKVKGLQQKYKGNRQKLNEETMKLYKEHGVNPFSGCLPILAQFPVLIALFSVLQFPNSLTHMPRGSQLERDIAHQQTTFLGMNLLCNAQQAGTEVEFPEERVPPTRVGVVPKPLVLDCGSGVPARIPYYVLAAGMIATTFYSQRQMQRASPPGQSQQQQTLTRIMPLLFGVWGFFFAAGLVLYWTTTNLVQIGQQTFLLRRGHVGLPAAPAAPVKAKPEAGGDGQVKKAPEKGGKPAPRTKQGGPSRSGGQSAPRKGPAAGSGQRGQGGGQSGSKGGAGGRNAGDRKKRRKR